MTKRYCLKYELGLCPREPMARERPAIAEPCFLVDDEQRKLRLVFRCDERPCLMEIVYEG